MMKNREKPSLAEYVSSLPETLRQKILSGLTTNEVSSYNWDFWCRPKQVLPPDPWRVWLILAGRGFGKTRTGAESVRKLVRMRAIRHIALVGETEDDVRNVMIEGPSGVLAVSPRTERPLYEPSKRRLTWPNGAVAGVFSGSDPDQLRGPQHDFAWVDELAKFLYAEEVWQNLMMGLRIGINPRCIVTTTPRPLALLKRLLNDSGRDVYLVQGTTFENTSNLASGFVDYMNRTYGNTTIGRQELLAELLNEVPGALWKRLLIERGRCQAAPELVRVAVGVDPSVNETGNRDACGIIVAGTDDGRPSRGYILEDATVRGSPRSWARAVADVFHRYRANFVVAEGNQGGGLVRDVLDTVDSTMPVAIVYASRGKAARAEPVSALYEQGRVFHVGALPELEDELVSWVPGGPSPNRLDALVWVLTELLIKGGSEIEAEVF